VADVKATRERIMGAMVELVCEQGYESVSLEEILVEADTRQEDFDALFASKEECAVAILDEITTENIRVVREAYDSEPQWPDSMRASAYAQARWISENPLRVRFGMVEMLWAGELTQALRERAFRNYVEMVDDGRKVAENPDAIPAFTAEAAIGSMTEMMTKRLQREDQPSPREFIPELMYLAVLPYLGEEAAQRELTMPPPGETAA
jgi:AcrR family transcriptional regulator